VKKRLRIDSQPLSSFEYFFPLLRTRPPNTFVLDEVNAKETLVLDFLNGKGGSD
jgi:hypothetical protein